LKHLFFLIVTALPALMEKSLNPQAFCISGRLHASHILNSNKLMQETHFFPFRENPPPVSGKK